jgi:hypothetical protein
MGPIALLASLSERTHLPRSGPAGSAAGWALLPMIVSGPTIPMSVEGRTR